MSTDSETVVKTTEAGSARRWTGLQIDMAHKFRAGQLSMDHIKWFLDLTKEDRNKLLLASLPVKATHEIAEGVNISFVEIDPNMLGLSKQPHRDGEVINLAYTLLDLEMCSHDITRLAELEYRDLFFGRGFVSRHEKPSRRVYFISRLYLCCVDLSGQE